MAHRVRERQRIRPRDAASDGKSHAVAGIAEVQTDKALEDAWDFVFGDARSVIGDDRFSDIDQAAQPFRSRERCGEP